MAEPGASQNANVDAAGDGPTPLGAFARALLTVLRLLPKNTMSRCMGRFASIAWPGPIQRAEIRLFALLAGVDLAEARDDVGDFATLQQFFTRALIAGARPIEGDDDVLVSPCDGAWGAAGRIEEGTLLQVKGRRYRVADLLGHEAWAAGYDGGCYATLYLSPRDYHRFHTPAAGRITRLDYLPGALWPVNSIGLQGVEGLFARNERICAELTLGSSADSPGILMIAVGATMVGSVRLAFDELSTNVPGAAPVTRRLDRNPPVFARGEEWGHFEFGSTIVLLTPKDGPTIDPKPVGTPLRLGEAIGRVRESPRSRVL
ncbi:MAG: phosphatidylserine decarboxylase [Deltaproteobacteria bacterium]|nr:phosphatidylserine decarboxylase [Deltaproteobacteria bacterium]